MENKYKIGDEVEVMIMAKVTEIYRSGAQPYLKYAMEGSDGVFLRGIQEKNISKPVTPEEVLR